MIYDHIHYTKNFEKQIKKVRPQIAHQFYERVRLFEIKPNDPMLNNHALRGKYEGYRSINVTGDVRALYFRDQGKIIFFAYIGTHSQLYR